MPSGSFHTTHWSMILRAGRNDSPRSREALIELCETYWQPLYSFLRRSGHAAHAAEEYVQAFFAHLLDGERWQAADPQRGRFRAFLLTCLKHFISNERQRAAALKRGGKDGRAAAPLSLDFHNAESGYRLEPSHDLTPEKEFDRRWAMTVLQRVTAQLRDEMEQAGKGEQFAQLAPCLTQKQERGQYDQPSAALGITPEAARVAVHRLRKRYRELLREEVGRTLAEPEQIDEEIRDLMAALAG